MVAPVKQLLVGLAIGVLLAFTVATLATAQATLTVTVETTRTSVDSGGAVILSAEVEGGTAPYTYAWTASGGSFSHTDQASTVWTGPAGGGHAMSYTLTVTATDDVGATGIANVIARVRAVPTPVPTPAMLREFGDPEGHFVSGPIMWALLSIFAVIVIGAATHPLFGLGAGVAVLVGSMVFGGGEISALLVVVLVLEGVAALIVFLTLRN